MNKSKNKLLELKNLCKHYPIHKGILSRITGYVHAVDGVSFSIYEGETLGLVGESGCGKSTVGRTILRLIDPSAGEIYWRGERIDQLTRAQIRPYRKEIQAVFQDPYSSLNPRMRAADIVAEPLRNFEPLSQVEGRERVRELFALVGLRPDQMLRYPHEFSGGQRQRLGIARALSVKPKLIMCDEPVSALDVSVQAQVINLLGDLQQEFAVSYLFIAHDLAVVKYISHRIAVMYLGRIVELAETAELFNRPSHPYTEALLSAIPIPDPKHQRKQIVLRDDVPSPINRPSGCHFHTRCIYAQERCKVEAPLLEELSSGHFVACHFKLNT
ncbi:ABC transporter ATP-binding protein [Polynucleobacter sp. IMCC 29146]|uniref:ABC transporter ATP-binding protein n=1 Tax=Polynucleobacter sp. IMCC 29146 TaxID=2780953 RepID=UPI001F43C31B|nr:oligopeptide/dipeptide ABC transporter ATP-binding protein [Polynucleobacter sp. IMCC 29146]MCE7530540.1 ATP-binding cassette domain-containing protein [Polynucleobacter sp. IMCC 29146]MCX7244944.1 ATP-binding cassette domain-containing protein [Burkholderiales bacterium]